MNTKRLKARTQAHTKSILTNLAVYFLLIGIGFVFLYPLLYMIITSLMTTEDLINPNIAATGSCAALKSPICRLSSTGCMEWIWP